MRRPFILSVLILLLMGIVIVILGFASSRSFFRAKRIPYASLDTPSSPTERTDGKIVTVIWTPQEVEGHECYQVLRHGGNGEGERVVIATVPSGEQESASGYFRVAVARDTGTECSYEVRSVGAGRTRTVSSMTVMN